MTSDDPVGDMMRHWPRHIRRLADEFPINMAVRFANDVTCWVCGYSGDGRGIIVTPVPPWFPPEIYDSNPDLCQTVSIETMRAARRQSIH